MKKENNCCGCEADFKNEVNHLVNEVEGYTEKDHEKKQAEVKSAFDKKDGEKEK